MTDVHSKETRSYNMSRIKGKNTKPEIVVRKYLFSKGLRYRLHQRDLPGTPDLVFRKHGAVVFIHGCFWHGHKGCKYFVPPKTNIEWWLNKINTTRKKDEENKSKLKKQGWKVISVWECSLKSDKRYKTLARLEDKIRNDR
jgi:DNA mismatch endonuclease, patch repair protein